MTPIETFAALPAGVKLWLLWLFSLQLGALPFLKQVEARWVLAALLANIAAMMLLQRFYGGGHHMSLPHVLFWTPLLMLLWRRRSAIRQAGQPYLGWCAILSLSIAASLSIDVTNLLRWLAA